MEKSYSEISHDGLWNNNVALVQILGLCPLLAVTATTVNGLGLGLATTLTLVLSSLIVSLIRNIVKTEVRIPVFVMIIASVVTAIELAMNAWFYELYKILGIFVPLIVTNCSILGRAEAFASKHAPGKAVVDALMMGIGFTAVLVVLGSMREIIGQGTLMHNAHLMFGEFGKTLTVTVIEDYRGFLLAILPPGAFLGLGLLIAVKNVIDASNKKRTEEKVVAVSEVEAPATQ
jgi:electron transport complex protein RnfE